MHLSNSGFYLYMNSLCRVDMGHSETLLNIKLKIYKPILIKVLALSLGTQHKERRARNQT